MSMIYEEDHWAWWTPTRAMFLALVNSMPAKQQKKVLETLEGLGKLRQQKGDHIAADYLFSLAGSEFVENVEGRTAVPRRPCPHLRVV